MKSSLFSPDLYNARIKKIPSSSPDEEPLIIQVMVADRSIFHPGFEERTAKNNLTEEQPNSRSACGTVSEKAARRAAAKLNDYILCNPDMDYFFTLTYNEDRVNREDYAAVIRRFNQWTDNRVRRNGLKYVAVAEYHKDGKAIHFHGLCNQAVELTDSGCVRCNGHKKPLKVSTADRYKIPIEERQTVYNIADWLYGYSTAIHCYGSREAVARYIGKYITKSGDKVGGRWYYHGGKLSEPIYEYLNLDYDAFVGTEVEFTENLHAKFGK